MRTLVALFCVIALFGCSSDQGAAGSAAPPDPPSPATESTATESTATESTATEAAPGATEEPPREGGSGSGSQRGCQQTAGQLVRQINAVIAQGQDRSLADLLSGSVLTPAQRQELRRLQQNAQQAGCSREQLTQLVSQRADQITGEGPVATAIREAVRSGALPF